MIYDGGSFEIMAMSWMPGDYSAIHDHGHAQWGAVQVFGPAEHAVFAMDSETITTLSRTQLTCGRIVTVGHDLVHQMGNPTSDQFLSLHVYGNANRTHDVTANARVFDLTHQEIQRTDGGVFYSLDSAQINSRRESPRPDYLTWLFDTLQRIKRGLRASRDVTDLLGRLTSRQQWSSLKEDLTARMDQQNHITDSRYWSQLFDGLREAAEIQSRCIDGIGADFQERDEWRTYAALYDHVIGATNAYMPKFMARIFDRFGLPAREISFVDVGCGTGWFESELTKQLGMSREQLLGIEPSAAMVEVARARTNVRRGGLLDLCEDWGSYDVSFCNSYQYLRHEDFSDAVGRMASITKPGGLCIGEFITQDHTRWYPNVVFAEDDLVVSLRKPTLHERGGCTYQHSEILNISRLDRMRITDEGTHCRFMVSPARVRQVFHKHFGSSLDVFDAITFAPLSIDAETCSSTRFVVCARRAS